MPVEMIFEEGVDEATIARTFGDRTLDFTSWAPSRLTPTKVRCGLSDEWGAPEVIAHTVGAEANGVCELLAWMFTCEDEGAALEAFLSDGAANDPGLQEVRPLASFGEPVRIDGQTWWQPPAIRPPHTNGLTRDAAGGVYWAVPIRVLVRRPHRPIYASCDLSHLFPHEPGYFSQLAEALSFVRRWIGSN